MTLEEAHQIEMACERRLLEAYPAADIMIHSDPCGAGAEHGADFFRTHDADPERTDDAS